MLYIDARKHLQNEYTGIFSSEAIEKHFEQYVIPELSQGLFEIVRQLAQLKPGQDMLDLGCGYGSFVLVSRQEGMNALGVDIAQYDLQFARERATIILEEIDAEAVYMTADAQDTGLAEASFDVITAWNVLEHVPDSRKLIAEAYRLLKPGGVFIGVAPNYFAFRKEAHYHVGWLPLLPHWLAKPYLRMLGRDTSFLENSIFYVTNWGILSKLRQQGFILSAPELVKLENPHLIVSNRLRSAIEKVHQIGAFPLVRMLAPFNFWNPFKYAIYFGAKKPV